MCIFGTLFWTRVKFKNLADMSRYNGAAAVSVKYKFRTLLALQKTA